jgi:hypothetical protein
VVKIRVDFTLEVSAESLALLRELANVDSTADAVGFVRAEAEDGVCQYLESNGIRLRRVRSAYPAPSGWSFDLPGVA